MEGDESVLEIGIWWKIGWGKGGVNGRFFFRRGKVIKREF